MAECTNLQSWVWYHSAIQEPSPLHMVHNLISISCAKFLDFVARFFLKSWRARRWRASRCRRSDASCRASRRSTSTTSSVTWRSWTSSRAGTTTSSTRGRRWQSRFSIASFPSGKSGQAVLEVTKIVTSGPAYSTHNASPFHSILTLASFY